VHGDPGGLPGAQQGFGQGPIVDLVVTRDEQAAAHPGIEHRLQTPALPAGEPLCGQSQ
jgi:hypothetical protein